MRVCYWCVAAMLVKSFIAVILIYHFGLPATAEAQVVERFQVNAMEYPWSAIGRVNTRGGAYCSGFLVSERHVLTAAHCLYDYRAKRWRSASELHFVAGYQLEQSLIHSPVLSFRRRAEINPPAKPDFKGQGQDWAVLTLRKPIGRQAGWLGLAKESPKLIKRYGKRKGHLIQAGYSGAQQHAITINPNCKTVSATGDKRFIMYNCPVMQGDSGSPLLLNDKGKMFAVAIHLTSFTANGKVLDLSGVLPITAIEGSGLTLSGLGLKWGEGKAPANGSLAAAKPIETNERLLRHLGYLKRGPAPVAAPDRHAAVEAFMTQQKESGAAANEMGLLCLLLAAMP